MIKNEIYISRLSAWAPGISSNDEWTEWANGKKEIVCGDKGPEITFTDPIFRRRLSQISKMTIQVIHDLLPLDENTALFFLSFRGELSRQYQINKTLIKEKSLMPAAFSLSVFNTPIALATIAFGLKGGYSAVYPGNNSFTAGFKAAAAALLCGNKTELVFVYADEEPPEEYKDLCKDCDPPLAFALLLSREPQPLSVTISSMNTNAETKSPAGFLKGLITSVPS